MKPCLKISITITIINKLTLEIAGMWDICSASAANKDVQVNQILELRSEKKRLPSLLKGKSPKTFEHRLVLILQGYLSGSRSGECRGGCRCACIQAAVRIYQHSISTHSLSAGRGSVFPSINTSFLLWLPTQLTVVCMFINLDEMREVLQSHLHVLDSPRGD